MIRRLAHVIYGCREFTYAMSYACGCRDAACEWGDSGERVRCESHGGPLKEKWG